MSNNIKYSICMINLNMESTIEKSIESIASQLNEEFEIIICDGGSTDQSIKILEKLSKKYENINVIKLKNNWDRKKGIDRNASVYGAKGKYVLLHLDCDDLYGENIQDWVKCFHRIEEKYAQDMLVSGRHINMLSKSLFEKLGGYKNIEFEDRDLWMRAASNGQLVVFDHYDFVTRMPRTFKQKLYKNVIETYYAVESDLRQGLSVRQLLKIYFQNMLRYGLTKNIFIKIFYLAPAYLITQNMKKLNEVHGFDPKTFSDFLKNNRMNLTQILGDHREIEFHNPESKQVFYKHSINEI